ncbi:25565_t:CDS:1, partial [Racocetra persica]
KEASFVSEESSESIVVEYYEKKNIFNWQLLKNTSKLVVKSDE